MQKVIKPTSPIRNTSASFNPYNCHKNLADNHLHPYNGSHFLCILFCAKKYTQKNVHKLIHDLKTHSNCIYSMMPGKLCVTVPGFCFLSFLLH